jgi:hypothetical protein
MKDADALPRLLSGAPPAVIKTINATLAQVDAQALRDARDCLCIKGERLRPRRLDDDARAGLSQPCRQSELFLRWRRPSRFRNAGTRVRFDDGQVRGLGKAAARQSADQKIRRHP